MAIVSIDGLRPDALKPEHAPNILALAARGAYTWQAQTVLPSITLTSHASMLSGYEPRVHGMTWGNYQPERGTIPVPTALTWAKAAALRTVMIVGKAKLLHLNIPGSVDDFVLLGGGDQAIANEAIVRAGTGFDLMFVHLPDTDLTGHAKGWLSADYFKQLERTDQALGRILAALPPQTTVIVTADHGGRGKDHGSADPTDTTIPWLIAGPYVASGHAISGRVRTFDTAATALFALGLALPPGAAGKPVLEAFDFRLDNSLRLLFAAPGER